MMDTKSIKSTFIYNPVTGIIQSKDGNPVKLSIKKGTNGRADRLVCYFSNKEISANKIPFAITHGYIPNQVRNIDGDISNLSLDNLFDPKKINRESITRDIVRSLIDYDPNTGLFTWTSSYGKRKLGDTAGAVRFNESGKSYLEITILGVTFKAHRLAFLFVTGDMPEQVDHDNGDGLDNRWVNLNSANKFINAKNQRLKDTNTSGIPGVGYEKNKKLWRVRINVDGVRVSLGRTKDFFKACCMRKSAELKYGYNRNHGSVRPL
ncbi:HNH endonuclease [Vibrio phage D85]|nr:hypothetical protein PODOV033v1_p0007 [Vibrio phage 252E42.2]